MQFYIPSGVGSTPVGSSLGGASTQWGLFTSTLNSTNLIALCESCSRERSRTRLGGVAVFASYVENGKIFVVASDVVPPVTCFDVRFDGPDGVTFTTQLSLVPSLPPPVASPAPLVTAATPPPGAILASSLLSAVLPEVDITGDYAVTLVDRCGGIETPLSTVTLEASPMILTPLDADLGGAPIAWLHGAGGRTPGPQPASGSRSSIPFDRCPLVIEYDARFGLLPGAAGFTHGGAGVAGDYQLVEGGALRAITLPALDSYWSKQIVMAADPGQCFSYAMANIQAGAYAAIDDGLVVDARYSSAPAVAYQGVRYALSMPTQWRVTKLDSSADDVAFFITESDGWTSLTAAHVFTPLRDQAWSQHHISNTLTQLFGTDGASVGIEGRLTFGDVNGLGIDAEIRNVVASFGGRYIRPWFTTFAQVTNPVIRLYLVADANGSAQKTARFRVRYGTGTGAPYAVPTATQESTVAFTTPNIVYEVPLQLTGLTANSPFWFTLERVWDNGDDKLDATVHFLQATVRSL